MAIRRARVLLVGGDATLAATLTSAGFGIRTARTGAQARCAAREFRPELGVLALSLPDESGLDLCRTLRTADASLGVMLLGDRDSLEDRLSGLALGADDFLTAPFHAAELVARLNVLLRRVGTTAPTAPILRVGDLELDERTHAVRRASGPIALSPTEFRLLRYFMRNPGVVLSRQEILGQVWHFEIGAGAVVEKFVSQLRRKIDAGTVPLLHTVRGFGYVLRAP